MLLKIKKCGKKSAQKHTHAIQAFFYNDKKIKTDRGRQGDVSFVFFNCSFNYCFANTGNSA
jgi:hypothetical protein